MRGVTEIALFTDDVAAVTAFYRSLVGSAPAAEWPGGALFAAGQAKILVHERAAAIEGGPPNALYRRGFSQKSLPQGSEIVVEGFRAKDGSLRCNGRDLTFADGRRLFVGSSGTGAPRDGRDATEK